MNLSFDRILYYNHSDQVYPRAPLGLEAVTTTSRREPKMLLVSVLSAIGVGYFLAAALTILH
jgi:hypothetical protein